jgi:hypothetical protein
LTPDRETTSLESSVQGPKRIGYWADHKNHPYHRLSVETFITEFCGWQPLLEMLDYFPKFDLEKHPHETEKYFFVTLFQTGARVGECLTLRRRNFTIQEDRIHVQYVLSKRYRKIGLRPPGSEKKWFTKKIKGTVREFNIHRSEPFSSILVEYLNSIPDMNRLLFPSHTKHHRKYLKAHLEVKDNVTLEVKNQEEVKDDIETEVNETEKVIEDRPLSKVWAYKKLREVNDKLPGFLKQKLGLYHLWLDEDGEEIVWVDSNGRKHSGEIHLWCHWARSQKASQMCHDYGMILEDVKLYFKWEDFKTAERYAHIGKEAIEKKMFDKPVVYV